MNDKLAREAKAIVALAFRNGPIENLHSGKICGNCRGDRAYSHITDDEIKEIMKAAVGQVYKILCLRDQSPAGYERLLELGDQYTRDWDSPQEP